MSQNKQNMSKCCVTYSNASLCFRCPVLYWQCTHIKMPLKKCSQDFYMFKAEINFLHCSRFLIVIAALSWKASTWRWKSDRVARESGNFQKDEPQKSGWVGWTWPWVSCATEPGFLHHQGSAWSDFPQGWLVSSGASYGNSQLERSPFEMSV